MSKKHKKPEGGEPEMSVRRDVKEAEAVQQHWHLTDRQVCGKNLSICSSSSQSCRNGCG